MIEVHELRKRYGPTVAIDGLDFQVERGEVVGFLGKNGAGKTTTMRILAGSLGATSGRVKVAGHDVVKNRHQVQRSVGYLPENPPLYLEMTVAAYLGYCARLKGVRPSSAVDRTLRAMGLSEVSHRLIKNLSKGYRQRVGLAQALVHSPSLLILDEPTSGLDPAQRLEIRELVRELAAGDTTVLLSTHVLQEVEAVCDRVLVLSGGSLVADAAVSELSEAARRVRVRVARPTPELEQALRGIEGVSVVSSDGDVYSVTASHDVREDVARVAVTAGLLELGAQQSLEEAFLRLTEEQA